MDDAEFPDEWDHADHVFAEEQEPSGRLVLTPCMACSMPALAALEHATKAFAAIRARIREDDFPLAHAADIDQIISEIGGDWR